MASGNNKETEALLKPQSAWVDGGRPAAAGAAATGPWRSSATRSDSSSKLATSRFDTSIGGSRWREEEREPVQRRDNARWVEGGEAAGPAGRQYAEPQNPAWTDVPSRGRGRVAEVDSWKPREREGGEWRTGNDGGGLGGGGGSWRNNDRWGGGAPGAPRGDSWRGGGPGAGATRFGPAEPSMDGSRGFGMGRGRGRGGGGPGGIGGGGAPSSSAFVRTFGSGGGVGGKMRWGASKAGHRYNTDHLARQYKQMLYAGRLKLPAAVERDDPLLFLGEGEFVDVVEQLMGVDPAEVAQAFADHYSMMRSYSQRPGAGGGEEGGPQRQHSALLAGADAPRQAAPPPAEEYVYKDPQGVVQGPFARQDIIDWYDAGYFTPELEVRASGEAADAPFRPLAALLRAWNKPVGPPGFAAVAAAAPAQPEAAAAAPEPAPEPEPEPERAPVQLPEAEDLLAASLHHLDLAPAAAAAAAAAPQAPEPSDPIIDPALVKRSASAHLLLAQQQAAQQAQQQAQQQQHQQHQQHQQQHALPLGEALPLGGPLAQLHAMGSGRLHAGLLPQPAHPHMGLLPQQEPFLPRQPHPLQAQHLPPAPMPHHLQPQFVPLGPQMPAQPQQPELPAWLTEATPGLALAPQPAPQPPPAPAAAPAPAMRQQPAAPAAAAPPRPSLLDIQREQQAQEARLREAQQLAEAQQRAAALEEEEQRRQQHAALLYHHHPDEEEEGEEQLVFPPPPPPPRTAAQQPQGPRPETKAAPWAGATPKKKTGKTLLEIQEEEAARAARLAAEEAAAAAAAPPGAAAPMGGWAKKARGNISGGSMMSLREIQEEEQRQREAEAAEAAALAAAIAASEADAGPSLGQAAAAAAATGAPAWAAAAAPAAAAAAANEEDAGLFWDYGVQAGAAAPAKPMVAAVAPPQRKPAAAAPKAAGWASAVAATTPAAIPAPPPAPAPRAAPPPPARPAPAAAPAAAAIPSAAPAAPMEPEDAAAVGEATSDGSSALAGAFRAWCQGQMRELTGAPDVTLCEFLLTVESNSELAEYCTLYLGSSPAVARFAAEFMRRKLAEAAAATKQGKSRKSKAKAAAAAAAAAAAPVPAAARAPAAGPPGYAAPGGGAAFPALGAAAAKPQPAKKDADWEKVPKTAGGKKKKKGQKLDNAMLGFSSGTNFALLEQPNE